ncbi:hypothetical protein GCM10027091_73300 [Streptomyces daliensis]
MLWAIVPLAGRVGTTRATGPPHANETPKGHPPQAHPHKKQAPRVTFTPHPVKRHTSMKG